LALTPLLPAANKNPGTLSSPGSSVC
jgi:hypothetical protein